MLGMNKNLNQDTSNVGECGVLKGCSCIVTEMIISYCVEGVWGYFMQLFIRYFEIFLKGEPLVMVSLRISP